MPQEKKQHPAGTEPSNHESQHLNSIISDHVMGTLGRPKDLLAVNVRCLWKRHYRVNVVVGPDLVTSRIAHSYFVVADDNGQLKQATPKLVRRYEPAAVLAPALP